MRDPLFHVGPGMPVPMFDPDETGTPLDDTRHWKERAYFTEAAPPNYVVTTYAWGELWMWRHISHGKSRGSGYGFRNRKHAVRAAWRHYRKRLVRRYHYEMRRRIGG